MCACARGEAHRPARVLRRLIVNQEILDSISGTICRLIYYCLGTLITVSECGVRNTQSLPLFLATLAFEIRSSLFVCARTRVCVID